MLKLKTTAFVLMFALGLLFGSLHAVSADGGIAQDAPQTLFWFDKAPAPQPDWCATCSDKAPINPVINPGGYGGGD